MSGEGPFLPRLVKEKKESIELIERGGRGTRQIMRMFVNGTENTGPFFFSLGSAILRRISIGP